jgi:hypothetical protein
MLRLLFFGLNSSDLDHEPRVAVSVIQSRVAFFKPSSRRQPIVVEIVIIVSATIFMRCFMEYGSYGQRSFTENRVADPDRSSTHYVWVFRISGHHLVVV